eukprot:scaffold22597_cov127-Cylindrotheca_fusiformis.AAC.9
MDNLDLVDATDKHFLEYKPYLKGYLSSQLLCRLSIPTATTTTLAMNNNHNHNKDSDHPSDTPSPTTTTTSSVDFWGILNIQDEFDKAYIIAQIERFCSLYQIHSNMIFDATAAAADPISPSGASTTTTNAIDLPYDDHAAAAAAAAAAANGTYLPPYMTEAAAAAVAAASDVQQKLTKKQASEVSKAHRMAKDAEKALELERKQNQKREQKRLSLERKEQKAREREAAQMKKAQERMAREMSREERRQKKLNLRLQREKFAQEQKEAALKRAAELVASNRVPIEITRGAAAAKAAATTAIVPPTTSQTAAAATESEEDRAAKRRRSAIVVSTARDLHQIVTHSKNLWAKYNAIAKEHNQKVNWITVAKELGIHVKVREKYARMHSRAEQRGFDWDLHGDWKVKDHPEIFLVPTQAEQKAKMPPPPPDEHSTVLINQENNKEIIRSTTTTTTDDAAAVAAAAATSLDAPASCSCGNVVMSSLMVLSILVDVPIPQ